MADIPLDFGTLEKYGCFIGSAAVIVLSEQDDVKAAALNLMRFFEDESCGQCTPCRVGTAEGGAADGAAGLGPRRCSRSWRRRCAMPRSAASARRRSNPLTHVMRYFPEEFAPKEAAE